jgi:hypothetical protein
MNQQEFSQPEREAKLGISLWPDWHYGVRSMYGSHLALNHFSGTKHMNVVKLSELIDYPSDNTENINTKLHIHVFHGDELFSKFALKQGDYDNMTVNDTVANQIKYYCLEMALDARRSTSEDLNKILDEKVFKS